MKIEKIGTRSSIFTFDIAEWQLNIQLIKAEKHNFLIDTGLGWEQVEPIKEYLKDEKKPLLVINTHTHWDHTWGNQYFKEHMIIAHKWAPEQMVEYWQEDLEKNGHYTKDQPVLHLPNLTFDQELYFPEDNVRLIYTPGHTIDGISVIDEFDRVLNTGDNIGDCLDYIVPSLRTGKEVYRQTIEQYMELDVDICLSGHNYPQEKGIFHIILDELNQEDQ